MKWLGFAACAMCVSLAHADPRTTVYLEELTWTELKGDIGRGMTTAIVPIGGTEQNGPFIALGKHNARVRVLSGEIARRLGNAIVAPVIAYVPEGTLDPPTEHMRFPGTITIPTEAFELMLESTAESLRLHGFRNIVFLGDHGGYRASVDKVVHELNRKWSHDVARAFAPPEYYDASSRGFNQLLEGEGFSRAEIGTHAGLADTSLLMATNPELVRGEASRAGDHDAASQGVLGDPRRASAKLGAEGVALIVNATVRAIQSAIANRTDAH